MPTSKHRHRGKTRPRHQMLHVALMIWLNPLAMANLHTFAVTGPIWRCDLHGAGGSGGAGFSNLGRPLRGVWMRKPYFELAAEFFDRSSVPKEIAELWDEWRKLDAAEDARRSGHAVRVVGADGLAIDGHN